MTEKAFYAYGMLSWKVTCVCKYDSKGNKTEEAKYDSDGSLSRKWIYKYDSQGNITEETKYEGEMQKPISQIVYTIIYRK